MAKPKAPVWLREAFAEGSVELAALDRPRAIPAYRRALGRCWLAQFDPRQRPCSGRLERIHLLRRQTVEDKVGALLPYRECEPGEELALLAAWDARNSEIACEGHHRRFDHHLTPPLPVPPTALPARLLAFSDDYGLDHLLAERFPG